MPRAAKEAEGKTCVVLYCGDHDPGGLSISQFFRENMGDLSEAFGWRPDNVIVDRFGLNYEFISRHGLTWVENLETSNGGRLDDPRHPHHRMAYVQTYLRQYGARKVEANALVVRPEAGRDLCRAAILKYVPAGAVDRYEDAIALRRAALETVIRNKLAGAAT